MNNYQAHQNLVKNVMIAISNEHPDVLLIPYTVGMFRAWDNPDRVVHAGRAGVPDLIAFGKGWFLFMDAKTGKADFNDNQKNFIRRVAEIMGNHSHVKKIRSVSDALALIAEKKRFHETFR